MRDKYPLISCICVTNNRTEFLKRAINCFASQNYPNKELVISYPFNDSQTKELIADLMGRSDLPITRTERSDKESVGNARNEAISKCKGDYVCVWDDDDWYHPSRLSFQFNSMNTTGIGFNASVLTRVLLFDNTTQKAYMSFSYCWENTLLCRKEIIMQNQYAHQNRGEDTHIIKFLDGKKFLHHIQESPFLYVYIYHGQNTWNYQHYEYLMKKSELLSDEVTASIRELIS
ncbi:MAG: glycosyltransferase family A protein [Pedobacter sp.]|uniref:glycosyltransferase family 2 protein n=1 Tax=Pedobacter sp. TaxID=1411316 RepID=UPI0033931BC2